MLAAEQNNENQQDQVVQKVDSAFLNPLSPKRDQNQFSSNNIHTCKEIGLWQ